MKTITHEEARELIRDAHDRTISFQNFKRAEAYIAANEARDLAVPQAIVALEKALPTVEVIERWAKWIEEVSQEMECEPGDKARFDGELAYVKDGITEARAALAALKGEQKRPDWISKSGDRLKEEN